MAAAAKKIQLALSLRIPLTRDRAIYCGTALGGAEYETGGVALEEDATNSRVPMPAHWDYLKIDSPTLVSTFVSPNKIKLSAETTVGTSTETGLSEYKSAANMAAAIPAGTPFFGVGAS